MPIDPATGQSMPYAGEPGAPPMAPAASPPAGGPPMAGEPGVEDLEQKEQEEAMAKMEAIGATAPIPKKPYTVKTIQMFAEQVDAAIDSLAGTNIPLPAWEPDPETVGKAGRWPEPLPLEVYAPAVALVEAVRMMSEEQGGKFDKHLFEPTELWTDGELKVASGKMKTMAKDKALMNALQAPMAGEAPAALEEEGELPGEGEMSAEDQALMGAM